MNHVNKKIVRSLRFCFPTCAIRTCTWPISLHKTWLEFDHWKKMPTASTLHWFGVLREEAKEKEGKKHATLHKWKGFHFRWTKQISRLKCLCVCLCVCVRCAYVWKEKRQKVLRWLLQWMSDTIRYGTIHTFRWILCMRNKKATNQFFHFSFWTIQLWMRSVTLWSPPYSRWCD